MKQPKTWDELLEAGYVIEPTENQLNEAKEKIKMMTQDVQKKADLIEKLVNDFKNGEGKDQGPRAAMQLKQMLSGFEISDLELLASQIK